MLAPHFAEELVEHITKGVQLNERSKSIAIFKKTFAQVPDLSRG